MGSPVSLSSWPSEWLCGLCRAKSTSEAAAGRSRANVELPLSSYKAFQSDGRMQRAVARKVLRQCSMRQYEGALDECIDGYGIKRSSVSRQFKVTSAARVKELVERPVPPDLQKI